jgi:molybdenum cofactor biosynthesis enzyme MoaA
MSLNRRLTVRFIEYMPLGDAAIMHVRDELANVLGARASSPALSSENSGRGRPRPREVPDLPGAIAKDELGPAGGCGAQDRGDESLIPEAQVRRIIEDDLGPLIPIERADEAGVGPANVYRLALGRPIGRIGFISAMSAPFCATCNRLRLTANGVLRSCLFEGGEVDVRDILRSTHDPVSRRVAVAQAMVDCVALKPDVHGGHGNQQMSRMGG